MNMINIAVKPKQKPIAVALRELKDAALEISLCSAFLDSLIVFMVFMLVLKLITLPWYYAFAPFIIYALLHTFRHIVSHMKLSFIETLVPDLKDELRTVADYLDKDNEILQSLNDEVLGKMKNIRTSYFFSFGRLTREFIMLISIAFLITGASAYNVQFIDFTKIISEVKAFGKPGEYELNQDLLVFEEASSDEDIYGDANIAELGNELINLEVNPIFSDVDISKIKDPNQRRFSSSVPREISARTDASFEETIPKDYQRIVKSYFSEITRTR